MEKHDGLQSASVKNSGHHCAWCPCLNSASSCSLPAFLFLSELVMGLWTGILCMSDLTVAFVITKQTFLTKWVMHHTPGCLLLLWIDMIWPSYSSSMWTAPISGLGLWIFFITLNHSCGTIVSQSAIFWVDGTNVTSMVSLYFFTSFLSVFSCLLMSILLAALVHTCTLVVRVFDT